VSIVCGYRLFLAGVFGVAPGASPTTVSGKFAGVEFTLKSVAPGTCFALFGAAIISITITGAPPQFGQSKTSTVTQESTTVSESLTMRGSRLAIEELVEQAKRAESQGDKRKAIESYQEALRKIAEPLNNLAWLYHGEGRDQDAEPLAKLAVQFGSHDPQFSDTLTKIRKAGQKK
jgi:hypothetical protein